MRVYTLGPTNTNCERASHKWIKESGKAEEVILCKTLEDAVEELMYDEEPGYLVSCIVYPKLHELVFTNRANLKLVDSFIMNTIEMVLATNGDTEGKEMVVATHPAPVYLIPADRKKVLVTSNSQAARTCARGETNYCITTMTAAEAESLMVVESFGEIPMGFAVHEKTKK